MGKPIKVWRVEGTIMFRVEHYVEAETYEDALGIAGNEVADLRFNAPDCLQDDYVPDIDVYREEESEDEDTDEESEDD